MKGIIMSHWIIILNPNRRPATAQDVVDNEWACCRGSQIGDRFWVYVTQDKQNPQQCGFCYEWKVVASPERKQVVWADNNFRWVCKMKHICDINPPISRQQICNLVPQTVWNLPHANMRGRPQRIPEEAVNLINVIHIGHH
jgi:hypothetical protein